MKRNFPEMFKRKLLPSLIILGMQSAYAGVVRDDVDYQQFRDFAENKGKFAVGASNVEIFDNDGNSLGKILENVPMIDFSAVDAKTGANTLIASQYVVSVIHNSTDEFNKVVFGDVNSNADYQSYNYSVVDIDEYEKYDKNDQSTYSNDYKTSRLNKLVTEVVPVIVGSSYTDIDAYLSKYSNFIRVGAGRQGSVSKDDFLLTSSCRDDLTCVKSYSFLTGGDIILTDFKDDVLVSPRYQIKDSQGELVNYLYSAPFLNIAQVGDSGSPVFGFNKETQQWELIALHANSNSNYIQYGYYSP